MEDAPHRDAALQPVSADRFQSSRGKTAAVRAIRVAAELARRDPALEIRGEASVVCANTHSSGDRGGRAYTSSTGSGSCSFENRGRSRRKSAITRARSAAVSRSAESSPFCGV